MSVGLDLNHGNGTLGAYNGRSVGQTFYARDTLVNSITVWRIVSQDTLFAAIHLYILEIDSTGTPRPDRVVLDWPEYLTRFGDGTGPVTFRFEFDPPIALPASGTYAFFLKPEPCWGWFDLYAAFDEYTEGSSWRTWRSSGSGCVLRANPEHYPGVDLCFEIEFCDAVTAPRRTTWGELKQRYR